MRARRTASVLCVLLPLLSGCLQGDGPPSAGGPLPEAGIPLSARSSYYLTEGMGLSGTPPSASEPQRVTVPGFYRAWAEGARQPTFDGGPRPAGLHVTAARVTLFYTSDEVAVTTGPRSQGFPEIVVYFGTREAPTGRASVQAADVAAAGEVVQVQADLDLPEGGLVIPPGAAPAVVVAVVQAQQDQGARIHLLVNGTATPSRIDLVAQAISFPTGGMPSALVFSGRLVGSAYVLGADGPATSAAHAVTVPPGTVALRLRLERVGGVGIADIDLEAFAPDGRLVARSGTPMPDEGIDLYGPNIGAGGVGSWSVRVVNFGHVVVDYRLAVTRLEGVPAA